MSSPPPRREGSGESAGGTQVLLTLNEPAAGLQELVWANASRFEALNITLKLLNWGMNASSGIKSRADGAGQWWERLVLARGWSTDAGDVAHDPGGGGIGFTAAVCVGRRLVGNRRS